MNRQAICLAPALLLLTALNANARQCELQQITDPVGLDDSRY